MKKTRKLFAAAALMTALAVFLSGSALAVDGEAFVATDALNMREGASLDYNVIDAAPRGAHVTVNFDAGYGWYQVTYNGKTGYMAGYYLLFEEPSAEPEVNHAVEVAAAPQAVETAAPAPAEIPAAAAVAQTAAVDAFTGSGSGTVNGTDVRLRSGPSMNSVTIEYLPPGAVLNIHGACGAWYEAEHNGNVGYVYGDYVVKSGQSITYAVTPAVTTEAAPVFTEPVTQETYVEPQAVPVQASSEKKTEKSSFVHNASAGQAIVDTAMQYLGVPYVWAGTSPAGFDCSGLVYYVYGQHGISLNRVAQAMYYNGVDVDLNDLQAGDIVLFGSSVYNIWHAGIYVGNGMFIHSPHSGEVVRTQYFSETCGMRLVAARRLV